MRLKSNILSFNFSLLLTAGVILILASCYERSEVCLDPLAKNFDVTGDDNCDDCCVFPALNINVISILGSDSTYTISDTITNNLGHRLILSDSRIYLYGFRLKDNTRLVPCENIIRDSLSVQEYSDDFVILRVQDRNLSVGEYKFAGQMDTISWNLGLSQEILKSSFPNVSSSHPLNRLIRLTDSLGSNSLANFTFRSVTDTVPVIINLTDLGLVVPITATTIKENTKGEAMSLTIYTHYDELMKNINPKDTPEKIQSILRQNISKFISVK